MKAGANVMLNTILEFFQNHMGAAAAQADDRHAIQVATAALLVEMVRMDGEIQKAERETVLRAVWTKFNLSADEAAALVRIAEEEALQATDYYQFTSLINEHFSPEQKERLIEHLWQIAYADADLHVYEEHLARKLANLLHVPHDAFIAAKLRARDGASS
ncbi:MAG: TerB family tellurite resistance protein [Burkholderiales bacterium]